MDMAFEHKPVLLEETIRALAIRPDGTYVDGTLGGAGHALEIVKQLHNGRLIAIDQDADAIRAAGERLAPFAGRVTIVKENFRNMPRVLRALLIEKADGILLDLGVSSFQLDTPERGFSYSYDAPLDMRMSRESGKSAYDVVNGYSEERLCEILRDYGEERYAKRIARAIAGRRAARPIESTFELSDIIKGAIPAPARREGPHPAKRSFQAIRIEVNDELGALSEAVSQCADLLKPGGRICIITFHSLEDRMVKQAFAALAQGCICPRDFPVCVCGHSAKVKLIDKKGVVPSTEEQTDNPRARSARLRTAQRL
jgi:16S rRNA (cytosine1402-N4)-methyltransferase